MGIYTKTGDRGFASTISQKNIPKNSPIFGVLGALDEMNAALGIAKSQMGKEPAQVIQALQDDLVLFCGELAGGKSFVTGPLLEGMEQSIDLMLQAAGQEGTFHFVAPGTTPAGAALDLARGIARRAERELVAKKQTGGVSAASLQYINRLSDLTFALARWADALGPKKNGKTSALDLGRLTGQEGGSFTETGLWLCERILHRAQEEGIAVVTAVCDAGAHLVALLRAPGAYIASIDIAQNKAFTSISLQMPTEELAVLAAPGGSLYGIQETNGGRIVIFAGGIPLYTGGLLVGGFGVSGGSAEQDKALADYAKQCFDEKYG